jgi:hypothetical protein
MAYSITMAGQNITSHVDMLSVTAKDILGQGAGSGATRTGRAATCEFLTDLGPANSALGAGSVISSPQLVRRGEVIITDSTNNVVFGGFVSMLTDRTDKKTNLTLVDCIDYWQALDNIQVFEQYSGVSDVYIIRDLFGKYAPWIDISHVPTHGSYQYTVKVFKSISLQKALASVTDVTGWQIWVNARKSAYYTLPTSGLNAPFSLSTSPDNHKSFTLGVDQQSGLIIDDNAIINRVTFWGGKNPSNDFTQDLSTQANGSNLTFVLAYYPRVAADGVFHINVANINSGADLTYGYILGKGTQNEFISKGGLAAVLINGDARTLNFDPGGTAPVNGGANSVTMTYRYEFPMIIQLTDKASHTFFGSWYDGVISDQTVFDQATAVARCRTLLAEQSKGLTTLKVSCWRGGIQSGQLLNIFHSARNINGTYMVQEVDTKALGNGLFQYDITCGAWNYNVVDSIMAATQAAYQANLSPTNDTANGQDVSVLQITQQAENVGVHEAWVHSTRQYGAYKARASAVGDGHDAYCGLCSVSS